MRLPRNLTDMQPTPPTSLSRTAQRFAIGMLALVALLPPLLWFCIGAAVEYGEVRSSVRTIAWMLDSEPRSIESVSLHADMAAALDLPPRYVRVSIEGSTAGAARLRSDVLAMPTFSVSAPLTRTDGAGHEVSVQRSLRPLLLQALSLALASCALAVALWQYGVHRTIELMIRAETRMRTVASIDPLTGLLNRDGLRRRLQRALQRRRDSGDGVGLLLLDLDRFNIVNVTLGQVAGDDLLRSVADRIRAVTRVGDGLARLSGDQFGVHVDSRSGEDALRAMARNLRRALDAPYRLEGREVITTVSIGVALASPDEERVDVLLSQAAHAVRAAKKFGGNRFCVYESHGDPDDLRERMNIEQRLHGALGAGQFFVVYQPIVAANSEEMTMAEALLRWRDPERGVVSPVEFIPTLEQTGLIVPVGRWILREACQQAVRWPELEGGKPIGVSVNLSPLQFAESDFLRMVGSVLSETGLAPERLQLEVTEGLLLDPTPQTLRKIDALTELGVRLAVDDFGMGYSSLMYLKRFRLHALKIDRMFVRDIAESVQDLTIVRAIIDLGHGLGMSVTAEGVETRAQSEALAALGCDSLQGYLYGRPVVASELAVVPHGDTSTGSSPTRSPHEPDCNAAMRTLEIPPNPGAASATTGTSVVTQAAASTHGKPSPARLS